MGDMPAHEKTNTDEANMDKLEAEGRQRLVKEKASVADRDKTKAKDATTWKRRNREETEAQRYTDEVRATRVPNLGATRQREEEECDAGRPGKKILYQVPPLEESLGVEGLRRLREYEENVVLVILKGIADSLNKNVKASDYKPIEEVAENVVDKATQPPPGPGAQAGSSWTGGELKEVQNKKTEPGTDVKEPGTEEGAWKKK
jgi:hypothetical protein